jgi:hypothetical protein
VVIAWRSDSSDQARGPERPQQLVRFMELGSKETYPRLPFQHFSQKGIFHED